MSASAFAFNPAAEIFLASLSAWLVGVDNRPLHQVSNFALVFKGSALPFLMDSRMPGTDKR